MIQTFDIPAEQYNHLDYIPEWFEKLKMGDEVGLLLSEYVRNNRNSFGVTYETCAETCRYFVNKRPEDTLTQILSIPISLFNERPQLEELLQNVVNNGRTVKGQIPQLSTLSTQECRFISRKNEIERLGNRYEWENDIIPIKRKQEPQSMEDYIDL